MFFMSEMVINSLAQMTHDFGEDFGIWQSIRIAQQSIELRDQFVMLIVNGWQTNQERRKQVGVDRRWVIIEYHNEPFHPRDQSISVLLIPQLDTGKLRTLNILRPVGLHIFQLTSATRVINLKQFDQVRKEEKIENQEQSEP